MYEIHCPLWSLCFIQFLYLNMVLLNLNFANFLRLTLCNHTFLLVYEDRLSLLNQRPLRTSGVLRNHGFVSFLNLGRLSKKLVSLGWMSLDNTYMCVYQDEQMCLVKVSLILEFYMPLGHLFLFSYEALGV